MMRGIPETIQQSASTAGLGQVEQSHGPPVFYEAGFIATLGLLGISGIIWGDDLGLRLGLVALLLALPVILYTLRKSRRRLYRCAGGLLIVRNVRRPGIPIAWSDIAHVRAWNTRIYKMDGPPETFYRCVLYLSSGLIINLAAPPYTDGADLTQIVVWRVAAIMYPAKLAELESQGTVVFGPITVTHDGIADLPHFAAWPAITRIDCGRVRLRIWADSGRPVISRQVRTIPDLAVLLSIMATQTGPHRTSLAP